MPTSRLSPLQLDFWQDTGRLDRPVDVMVPPILQSYVKEALARRGLAHDVMIDNVQAAVESQKQRDVTVQAEAFDYNVYHTYDGVKLGCRCLTSLPV